MRSLSGWVITANSVCGGSGTRARPTTCGRAAGRRLPRLHVEWERAAAHALTHSLCWGCGSEEGWGKAEGRGLEAGPAAHLQQLARPLLDCDAGRPVPPVLRAGCGRRRCRSWSVWAAAAATIRLLCRAGASSRLPAGAEGSRGGGGRLPAVHGRTYGRGCMQVQGPPLARGRVELASWWTSRGAGGAP